MKVRGHRRAIFRLSHVAVAVIYRWANGSYDRLATGCLTSRRVEKMSNEWVGFVKMRGSIWCVLAGLAVAMAVLFGVATTKTHLQAIP